ncbi:hypothetical protein ABZ799_01460 [Nocardiopsis dassonvillei]|uniref:hypothetical protein n=1 Tax=Nocardiopsis dassonvillei TaxID=2014 RepID=UPI0033F774F0
MSTTKPPIQILDGANGPLAMIRGTTDGEVRERLADWLADNPVYSPLHHHEWDSIHAGWIRANPCPPAHEDRHIAHYGPAKERQRGAFQGAFVELV